MKTPEQSLNEFIEFYVNRNRSEDVVLGYKTSLVAQMLDSNNKQEAIEEIAEKLITSHPDFKTEGFSDYQNGRFNGIIEGAEWQAAKMYSEEDMKQFAFECAAILLSSSDDKVKVKLVDVIAYEVNTRFEQFKKQKI